VRIVTACEVRTARPLALDVSCEGGDVLATPVLPRLSVDVAAVLAE